MEVEIYQRSFPMGMPQGNALIFSFVRIPPQPSPVNGVTYESRELPMYKVVVPDGYHLDDRKNHLLKDDGGRSLEARDVAVLAKLEVQGFRVADV